MDYGAITNATTRRRWRPLESVGPYALCFNSAFNATSAPVISAGSHVPKRKCIAFILSAKYSRVVPTNDSCSRLTLALNLLQILRCKIAQIFALHSWTFY